MNLQRVRKLSEGREGGGPVVYWMSRDQRCRDNWALEFAREEASKRKAPLEVAFCLAPSFLQAAWRQYHFMLEGLRELEADLLRLNISFAVLAGDPPLVLNRHVRERDARLLVTDFDPLRPKQAWLEKALRSLPVPVFQVDAHNVVPCWVASDRREFSARTFRPRLQRLLPGFLDRFPTMRRHPFGRLEGPLIDWKKLEGGLRVDRSVGPVASFKPGEKAARRALRDFIENRLECYATRASRVEDGARSRLSPYLHFGQLSAQRVALEVSASGADAASCRAFLEELLVRKELSDNFCFHEPAYDSFYGLPPWGKRTLNEHRRDPRPYLYAADRLEKAGTHDPLWNAAQRMLAEEGYLHGHLRMYWAKKILEWSPSPEEAMETAVRLNDRYLLDGRDPNGYAGIAWSIGGLHDRPFRERPIFGKVRYMGFQGTSRKTGLVFQAR